MLLPLYLFLYLSKVASSSAGSSLSARLGMGSAVHQAEASDKTFDDVIGIDEAKADLQVRLPFLGSHALLTVEYI